jgi:hypothetical protein
MKELELLLTKLKNVTTDGAPNMIGKKTGLMGEIKQEMDKMSQISHGTSLHHPPMFSLWKKF